MLSHWHNSVPFCPGTPCPHPTIPYQRPDAPPPPNLPPPDRCELPELLWELLLDLCELDLRLDEDELPEPYELPELLN